MLQYLFGSTLLLSQLLSAPFHILVFLPLFLNQRLFACTWCTCAEVYIRMRMSLRVHNTSPVLARPHACVCMLLHVCVRGFGRYFLFSFEGKADSNECFNPGIPFSNHVAPPHFLVADTQLYKRLCPSVGWSVGWLVGWWVGPWTRVEK